MRSLFTRGQAPSRFFHHNLFCSTPLHDLRLDLHMIQHGQTEVIAILRRIMRSPLLDSALTRVNSVWASEVISIHVGPNQEQFSAHAGFLIKSPTLLRKIVEGEWSLIKLEEHDRDTVAKMLEWLHCGYYTWFLLSSGPEQTDELAYLTSLALSGGRIVTLSPDISPVTTAEERNRETHWPRDDLGTSNRPLDILKYGLPNEGSTPLEKLSKHNGASRLNEAVWGCTCTGATLLPDAKLYVLAEYLELPRLKSLAFQNIQEVLKALVSRPHEMHSNVRAGLPSFVRFVYDCTDSVTNSAEPLRRIVAAFVAMKYSELQDPEFDALMWEGRDFAVDLMNMMHEKEAPLRLPITVQSGKIQWYVDATRSGPVVVRTQL